MKTNTKYIILVGDGMADYPLKELGGKTPLEVTKIPNMDKIASCRIGIVKTIPDGMEPGSDVANLSLMGYDPKKYHTGRSPLEAASIGVSLKEDQTAFRMNLVTLDKRSDDDIIMKSHSSGDISTNESIQIVKDLQDHLQSSKINIFPGIAYRHLLLWSDYLNNFQTIPPHDVLDQNMVEYLNNSQNQTAELIKKSWDVLKDHPVNKQRRSEGKLEANSIWLWGEGKSPKIPSFKDLYGLKGGVISAVDLLKGIGIYAGFKSIHVEGATGYIDTNYDGKVQSALNEFNNLDFIFLHVEAPDEASHNGNLKEKIQAIEIFDDKIVGSVLKGLNRFEDYRIMVVSDHYTPVEKKTHTSEPVPFAWADKYELESNNKENLFTENRSNKSSLIYNNGHELINSFLSNHQNTSK